MALISVITSNLGFCLKPPSSMKSHSHQLCSKAGLCHEIPQSPSYKKLNPIVNQASAKVETPLRPTGHHHPNLWDDDFIQSIPKHPYHEAPFYAERGGSLIREIKDIFSESNANNVPRLLALVDNVECLGSLNREIKDILIESNANNVPRLLALVDNVERLGIKRHFQKEIKEALDFVYRYWGECQRDLETTALGFRILRLHRYPVSPGMLGPFRTANGQFLCSIAETEEDKIRGILNLFRASHIAFRGEKILDEAKEFCTAYLNEAMKNCGISSNLLQEISFNLEYGWYTNLPRLEAKKYIQIYGGNESWVRMGDNEKLLFLAKMDFNAIQSLHQQELKAYSRWWRESHLSKLNFARHCHVEYFFMACAICEDERYSAFRFGLAKFSTIATYIDDIYDTYGTLDELKLLHKAIKKWDPTSIGHLPEYMQIAYMALYETVNEMDREATKIQGRDTLAPSRDAWEDYIDAMLKEVEWLAIGCIPILAEFIENGAFSSGTRATTLQPVLTIDEILSKKILPKIDYPSRFNDLLNLVLRLRGDIKSFKGEVDRGETNSSIVCYIKDNPKSTEEDALNYIKNLLDERLKELNWEYLKNDGVPTSSKDYAYDITRGFLHFYKERDGFSVSSIDIQNHVKQILIEPISMEPLNEV